jgi:hypothetical protein
VVERSTMDRQSNAISRGASFHVSGSRLRSLDIETMGNHGSIARQYAKRVSSGLRGISFWMIASLRWLGVNAPKPRNISDQGDGEGVGPRTTPGSVHTCKFDGVYKRPSSQYCTVRVNKVGSGTLCRVHSLESPCRIAFFWVLHRVQAFLVINARRSVLILVTDSS